MRPRKMKNSHSNDPRHLHLLLCASLRNALALSRIRGDLRAASKQESGETYPGEYVGLRRSGAGTFCNSRVSA